MNRRKYLATLFSGGFGIIAGCSGDSQEPTTTSNPTTTTQTADERTTTSGPTTTSEPYPEITQITAPEELDIDDPVSVNVVGEVDVHDGYYDAQILARLRSPEGEVIAKNKSAPVGVSDGNREGIESAIRFDISELDPGNYTVEVVVRDRDAGINSETATKRIGVGLELLEKRNEVNELLEKVDSIFSEALEEYRSFDAEMNADWMGVTAKTNGFEYTKILNIILEADDPLSEAEEMEYMQDVVGAKRVEYRLFRRLVRLQDASIDQHNHLKTAWGLIQDTEENDTSCKTIADEDELAEAREEFNSRRDEAEGYLDEVDSFLGKIDEELAITDYEAKYDQIQSEWQIFDKADGHLTTFKSYLDDFEGAKDDMNNAEYNSAYATFDELVENFKQMRENVEPDEVGAYSRLFDMINEYADDCYEAAREKRAEAGDEADIWAD